MLYTPHINKPEEEIENLESFVKRIAKNTTAHKPSNEEIALRLVEAWAGQVDCETNFGIIMNVYFDALNTLNKKEAKDAS